MQSNKETRRLEEERQDMNDLYRKFKQSVIHFNYEEKTAKLSTDGKDEKVLIFGSTFELLARLANRAKTCTMEKAFQRMKERTSN